MSKRRIQGYGGVTATRERSARRRTVRAAGFVASLICLTLLLPVATATANQAPGTPTLVLPIDGGTIGADAPQLFTVRASDPDGDPYSSWISVRDAANGRLERSFRTLPAASGENSSGIPVPPLPSGTYTWTAVASDLPTGARSAESASQSFSVDGSPDLGGGVFTGSASYEPPLPALFQPCTPSTTFSVSITSAAAVINLAPRTFVGFVDFDGSGSSAFCEGASSGSGSMELSASGLGAAGATIDCAQLSGQYTRVATHVSILVGGSCTLNANHTDTVTFAFQADLVPDPSDIGRSIANSEFDGAFVVLPAA